MKIRKRAAKYYEKLSPKLKGKVREVIDQLCVNPYANPNVKPLEGSDYDDYRIRIGSLRLLYRIHNDELIIIVLDIGPRGIFISEVSLEEIMIFDIPAHNLEIYLKNVSFSSRSLFR